MRAGAPDGGTSTGALLRATRTQVERLTLSAFFSVGFLGGRNKNGPRGPVFISCLAVGTVASEPVSAQRLLTGKFTGNLRGNQLQPMAEAPYSPFRSMGYGRFPARAELRNRELTGDGTSIESRGPALTAEAQSGLARQLARENQVFRIAPNSPPVQSKRWLDWRATRYPLAVSANQRGTKKVDFSR